MPILPKRLAAFIWHFIRSYKWGITGLSSVALFWGIQMSITPYFLKMILDSSEKVTSSPAAIYEALLWPVLFYFAITTSPLFIFRFYEYVILKTIPRLQRDIWDQMFAYVEQHSFRYFQTHYAGSIANKIADMGRSIEIIFTMITDVFLSHALALIIAGITMASVHPLFLGALVVWSTLFLSLSLWLSRKSLIHSMTLSEAKSTVFGKVVDSLSNISSVRLFGSHAYESRLLGHSLQDTLIKDQKLQWKLLKIKALQGVCATLFTIIVISLLVYLRMYNKVTVGDFALIIVLSQSIIDAVWRIADNIVEFNTAIGNARQAMNIIEPEYEIADHPQALDLQVSQGKIVFEKVQFGHSADRLLFENKNLTIEAGQKVALVGTTGSGKTTFVNLILRYFELNAGIIRIDGQDISKVTQQSLRESISMIPQEPILFHRTIWENIHYGNFEASDEEIIHAAQQAHCHDFIMKLPEGYQTLVGERGTKLSGGQRQRIAIARAFLKNAPILILDEATSSLDAFTERKLQGSLQELMHKRTTLIISHRLSTLENVDQILVFDHGKVIEQGIHADLIQREGFYSKLWNSQTNGGFSNKNPFKVSPFPQVKIS